MNLQICIHIGAEFYLHCYLTSCQKLIPNKRKVKKISETAISRKRGGIKKDHSSLTNPKGIKYK